MTASSNSPYPTSSDAASSMNKEPMSSASSGSPLSSDVDADMSSGMSSGMGSVGGSTDRLMNRAVGGAHHTIDRIAEAVQPHAQDLGMRAERMREAGDEWANSMRDTVRESPLAAVAVALAVGMLVARITR